MFLITQLQEMGEITEMEQPQMVLHPALRKAPAKVVKYPSQNHSHFNRAL